MFPQNQLKPEDFLSLNWNKVLEKASTLIYKLFLEYMVDSKVFQMPKMGHSTEINSVCKQLYIF